MKKTLTLILILTGIIGNAQNLNKEIISKNDRPILVGQINKEGLTKEPYLPWFNQQYYNYELNQSAVKTIKKNLNDYKVQIFMGTWCGDSKRQVPRFYKILEAAKYDMTKLEVVGVSNAKEDYKKSPTGEEKGLNIKRVPTFILYKKGKEIGRIIERPTVSLEEDMLAIIGD
ncbi:thioredoxin family protein [Spongiivirga citrea]|uniref:Thiol reductase thioredoxin n=1 Tax=Spongiivirga citrea TaxID=1481457 RepID=A0A6M0CP43_9FLAO|nr:thioredoxin family protein [Spongiivirga citrea]NER18703.1 thiol reductase thioredoxin [Spongiivirga citrea]